MPGGRPKKECVEEAIAQAICENLEIGMPLSLAAEAEGITRQTAYDWMAAFPEFGLRVTRARATGAKKLTQQSLEGGKGSSMAAWHLERRYRDDYAPPKQDERAADSEMRIIIEGGLPPSPR